MGDLFAPWHIIILVVVLVVLFGARRLPGAAQSLGQSMHIFKKSVSGLSEDGGQAAPASATEFSWPASSGQAAPAPSALTSAPAPAPAPADATQQQLADLQRQIADLQRQNQAGGSADAAPAQSQPR